MQGDDAEQPLGVQPRVFLRRWVMLGVFVTVSAVNSLQWTQYTIISDVVSRYYGVSTLAVTWTNTLYSVTYIPLILPASWLLDKRGLRFALVIAALGTCVGSWIKVGSLSPDRFVVTFLGQAVVASSQVFSLNLPARLAAVWFAPKELATACSIGVFGNQLGIAVGFVMPSLLVKNRPTLEEIGEDLQFMFYLVAGIATAILVLVLAVFQAAPPVPPSPAQAILKVAQLEGFMGSVRRLVTNPAFVLLLLSYSINIGAFYAISTLLNSFVISAFPGSDEAGLIGLVLVVAGTAGSLLCGLLLGYTAKFKETTLGVYAATLVGMVLYTYSFTSGHVWVVYVSAVVLGFFMTGYLPVGFEFAAELTYPEPEGTSSGLMNMGVQVFGIPMTLAYQAVMEQSSDLWANVALVLALVVGTVLTCFIRSDLRRLAAQQTKTFKQDSAVVSPHIYDNPVLIKD